MLSSYRKLTITMWLDCNLGFSQKAHSSDNKTLQKLRNGLTGCRSTTLLSSFCEFCHAGHRGSADPAAKGCTDDLKSLKSNRGVRRPSSQESSITNQRRMLLVSFGCWKRHCAQCLRGLKGWAFLLLCWTLLYMLEQFGKVSWNHRKMHTRL